MVLYSPTATKRPPPWGTLSRSGLIALRFYQHGEGKGFPLFDAREPTKRPRRRKRLWGYPHLPGSFLPEWGLWERPRRTEGT